MTALPDSVVSSMKTVARAFPRHASPHDLSTRGRNRRRDASGNAWTV